jgi:hypothetical protein
MMIIAITMPPLRVSCVTTATANNNNSTIKMREIAVEGPKVE